MKWLAPDDSTSRPLFSYIRFKVPVCWAGPNPLYHSGICFGSEDGRLFLTDENGNSLAEIIGSNSREPINGVSSWQRWVLTTTRAEVSLLTMPLMAGEKPQLAIVQAGAHGVTNTQSGYFVCPLGRSGLMVVKPVASKVQTATAIGGADDNPYFYRAISLKNGDQEVLACAMREGGVGAMEFRGEEGQHNLSWITFDGLDVVDLCPLTTAADSLAAAAVSKDGTLILFKDILRDRKPITVKFETVRGTAYRILSWGGDIVLLTNKGLHVLAKLAGRFEHGELTNKVTTPVLAMPMEAIDANLYGERWLLVVMPSEVRKYDLELIHDSAPEFGRPTVKTSHLRTRLNGSAWKRRSGKMLSPHWKKHRQSMSALVIG